MIMNTPHQYKFDIQSSHSSKMSSSIVIFKGSAADQACRAGDFKIFQRTANVIVKDIASCVLNDAAVSNNIVREHWAFAVLFGKPVDKGYQGLPPAIEDHPLLISKIDGEYVVSLMVYEGEKYSTWIFGETDEENEPNSVPLSTSVALIDLVLAITTTKQVPDNPPVRKPRASLPAATSRHPKPDKLSIGAHLHLKHTQQRYDKHVEQWIAALMGCVEAFVPGVILDGKNYVC
jgi:hypothetical protein